MQPADKIDFGPFLPSTHGLGAHYTSLDLRSYESLDDAIKANSNNNPHGAENAPPSLKDVGLCIMCNGTAQFCRPVCDGKSKIYCSKDCQKADWSCHKLLCSTMKDFGDDNRPTKDHFRGIFFPENSAQPKFVWLQGDCSVEYNAVEELRDENLDGNQGFCESVHFRRDFLRCVQRRFKDTFQIDGSLPNQSIIACTRGVAASPYAGPFVGTVFREFIHKPDTAEVWEEVKRYDATMADYRNMVDCLANKPTHGFMTQRTGPHASLGVELSPNGSLVAAVNSQGKTWIMPTTITALKIVCDNEQQLSVVEQFQRVNISWRHDLFLRGECPDLPARGGVPLICLRVPPSCPRTQWNHNFTASLLNTSFTPGRAFAKVPSQYYVKSSVGNVLVSRLDYKPITTDLMSAICDFALYHVSDLLKRYHEDQANASTAGFSSDSLLAEITPEKFQQFCDKREELRKAGEEINHPDMSCLCGSNVHNHTV